MIAVGYIEVIVFLKCWNAHRKCRDRPSLHLHARGLLCCLRVGDVYSWFSLTQTTCYMPVECRSVTRPIHSSDVSIHRDVLQQASQCFSRQTHSRLKPLGENILKHTHTSALWVGFLLWVLLLLFLFF